MISGTPMPLDGYTYAYLMFSIMYSRSVYTYLPLMINDLAERRTDRVESLLSQLLGGDSFGGISTGLYYSVVCGELYNPVRYPADRRMLSIVAAVDPLPLVPATWTMLGP